jgi:PBP1b-binding outer membrane lipoprotein LpoB
MKMKRAIILVIAIFLLAGCTPEVKESKQESKTATHKTEEIKKNQSQDAYNPLTEEETVYMKTIGKLIGKYSEITRNIQKLMKQANNDPTITKTDEWMNNLKGDFAGISVMSTLLKQMADDNSIPERFKTINSNLSDTFGLMVMAGDLLVQSIQKNIEPTLFNDSMQTMAKSNDKLSEVNKELDEINVEVTAN